MSKPQKLTMTWRVLIRVAAGLKWLLRVRVDVSGIRHVPTQGGAVLAFNHHSYADFVMLAWAVIVETRRPVRFLGKREVVDSKLIGWLARAVGVIPVDRGSEEGRAQALSHAVEALRRGELVALAPEQTISASLDLLPFRSGVTRMAQRARVPVVPVIGWGSQRLATYGVPLRPRFGVPVIVRFGQPREVPPDADPVGAAAELQQLMQTMLDTVQREYPDGMPAGARWIPARLGGSAPAHQEVLGQHFDRGRTGTIARTDQRASDDQPTVEPGDAAGRGETPSSGDQAT